MPVQPASASDVTPEQRAIERVLVIVCAERGDRLDHVEPAEVGGKAHRWAPVAATDRHVQQLRVIA